MKNKFLMIYFFLSVMSWSKEFFATAQEDFLHANSLYAHGDYKKAYKLYESIGNKGAAVWYNLGNCSYHLERYPEAIAYWKRALRSGGSAWRDEITLNCKHVQDILGIQAHDAWYEKVVSGVMNYSLLWWQLLVIIVLLSLNVTVLLSVYKNNTMLPGIMVLVLCFALGGLGIKYRESAKEYAIVSRDGNLVAGTDERFSKLAQLKRGEELLIYEKQGKWAKVATSEGVGWVFADTIITL